MKGTSMIVMAVIALSAMGVIALFSRTPLWQAVSMHIDHGLEAAGRERGSIG
jgi:hypothetical protein